MKKYKTIIADPPWFYRNNQEGGARKHYPLMKTSDICQMPINDYIADNAVLLLWATWPLIPDALQVISAWGFKYLTGFPWIKLQGEPSADFWGEWNIKPSFGVGYWIRGATEPLFIAKRGNPKRPKKDFLGLISNRFEHSRKPENLYHYAETLEPPYLELFARRKRSGWDSFGNEIKSEILIKG